MNVDIPVITIDGPSGTGKGTICALLADHLSWHRLDSGSIYRLLALRVVDRGLEMEDEAAIVREAKALKISFEREGHILLYGKEVSKCIRTEHCGQLASQLGEKPAVREALLERQRNFLQPPGLVADGRDMGTVVFPQALLKFYLTASVEVRGARRHAQLKTQGICVSLAQVVNELSVRDTRDSSRAASPLRPAEDAIVIDTTAYSVFEVLDKVLHDVQHKMREQHQ